MSSVRANTMSVMADASVTCTLGSPPLTPSEQRDIGEIMRRPATVSWRAFANHHRNGSGMDPTGAVVSLRADAVLDRVSPFVPDAWYLGTTMVRITGTKSGEPLTHEYVRARREALDAAARERVDSPITLESETSDTATDTVQRDGDEWVAELSAGRDHLAGVFAQRTDTHVPQVSDFDALGVSKTPTYEYAIIVRTSPRKISEQLTETLIVESVDSRKSIGDIFKHKRWQTAANSAERERVRLAAQIADKLQVNIARRADMFACADSAWGRDASGVAMPAIGSSVTNFVAFSSDGTRVKYYSGISRVPVGVKTRVAIRNRTIRGFSLATIVADDTEKNEYCTHTGANVTASSTPASFTSEQVAFLRNTFFCEGSDTIEQHPMLQTAYAASFDIDTHTHGNATDDGEMHPVLVKLTHAQPYYVEE